MESDGKSLSFAELDHLSKRLASLLRVNLQEGVRVSVLMENSCEYFVACCAVPTERQTRHYRLVGANRS